MNGKDAPTARSAADGRRPTTGSRGSRAGGSAASGKSKPPSLTPVQRQQVDAFFQALPKELADLVPTNPPFNLKAAVLKALAFGQPQERTAGQLVDFRLLPKWHKHYASRDTAGPIEKPVGALITMLHWDRECQDGRCDERTNVDTGQPCISCETRLEDQRADRKHAQQASGHPTRPQGAAEVPEPRPAAEGSSAPRRGAFPTAETWTPPPASAVLPQDNASGSQGNIGVNPDLARQAREALRAKKHLVRR
jgi:hypothetical protein